MDRDTCLRLPLGIQTTSGRLRFCLFVRQPPAMGGIFFLGKDAGLWTHTGDDEIFPVVFPADHVHQLVFVVAGECDLFVNGKTVGVLDAEICLDELGWIQMISPSGPISSG